ncbi:MAG: class I SAM-dependent methyltransferase [Chloroflexi bacterium]|nr:MAG: class I SAM-dependent methyltransferase [Chloroflexota bacterium]
MDAYVAMTEGSHGCPVCRDARRQAVVTQNGLGVVRCLRCGQRYVWPIPSDADLAAIYDPAYYRGGHGSVGFSDYAALTPARRQMFSRHLDRIERLHAKGRVLDVGCATGDFLLVAARRGWEALGVDPSPAREQAQSAGLRIVGRTIDDADVAPHSLDLITFWDVLEHLPDPVASLRRAQELLTPGGLVAATVPNAGTAVARLSGRRWFGYKTAGEHLQFFDPATISRCFEAAGFRVAVRRPVAWSCTIGFLIDRAALYLGGPGRIVHRALNGRRLTRLVVDVPQVNQFVAARPVSVIGSLAA